MSTTLDRPETGIADRGTARSWLGELARAAAVPVAAALVLTWTCTR